ncbi:SUMF1/EgtB/PvdO family nonheme iron enzyme [Oceanomicrobium pacificus]|uniref:SUMF1/EgtB/PvdO family nonheme iron enzyme n=1 Tax=Oceanomicrobium pacificus TaxID=2692916 RepID=A0A6B0TZQ5_9RHOB|nr:SUMF1/EgtB/PvdO family nonheme iron enzyme [Oceanomicrobium pacificus]MXU66742.1 SUMF1/EgtB/PvdO family nonheme iron enzyme [Oceanomicrobium pacificus]
MKLYTPVLLITLLGAALLAREGWFSHDADRAADLPVPPTVIVPAMRLDYRPAGQYQTARQVIDPPLDTRAMPPLAVMETHVSEALYGLCVDDGACRPAPGRGRDDHAQVFVSFADTEQFALWLADRTGTDWRLPTDREWAQLAAEAFHDDALGIDGGPADPAARWLAAYESQFAQRGDADGTHHPLGHFGANSLGVRDLGGNIWEWTQSCNERVTLGPDRSAVLSKVENCGVRVAQGRHRAYIIDFVRDARGGGCAIGIPPDYLGIRLVHSLDG